MSIENVNRDSVWSPNRYKRVIKKLRQYFTGYSPSDGFDLRKDPFKDFSQYIRSKIRKQFYYLDEILSGVPKRVYRARNRKKVKQIMNAQGVSYVPKNLKVAFIPDIERKTEVRSVKAKKVVGIDTITGRKVSLVTMAPIETVTMGVIRRYINIEPKFLLDSPLEAIRDAMRLSKADLYSIQAGVHEITEGEFKIPYSATDKEIVRTIDKLIKKYGNEDENNFWKNWLGGIIAYKFDYESDYDIYRNRSDQAKLKHSETRKRERIVERKKSRREKMLKQVEVMARKNVALFVKKERAALAKEIKKVRTAISGIKHRKKITQSAAIRLDVLSMQLRVLVKMKGELK